MNSEVLGMQFFFAACLPLFKLGGFLKSHEKAIKWSVQCFHIGCTPTFHFLQNVSLEMYSALSYRQWRRSFFAFMCYVIIVWQPEAYKWIPCMKQVLDVGRIHRGTQTCNPEDTHAPNLTDKQMCSKDLHTVLNNYTPTTADKSSFFTLHLSNFTSFLHPHTYNSSQHTCQAPNHAMWRSSEN